MGAAQKRQAKINAQRAQQVLQTQQGWIREGTPGHCC